MINCLRFNSIRISRNYFGSNISHVWNQLEKYSFAIAPNYYSSSWSFTLVFFSSYVASLASCLLSYCSLPLFLYVMLTGHYDTSHVMIAKKRSWKQHEGRIQDEREKKGRSIRANTHICFRFRDWVSQQASQPASHTDICECERVWKQNPPWYTCNMNFGLRLHNRMRAFHYFTIFATVCTTTLHFLSYQTVIWQ